MIIKTLLFKYDVENKKFSIEHAKDLTSEQNEAAFSFVSSQKYTNIKGIRFGFDVYKEKELVVSETFPHRSIAFETVTESFLCITPFNIDAGVSYTFKGWIELPGEPQVTKTVTVDKIYPPKPFPSWHWDDELRDWAAPVPKKYDKPYIWNEETLQWETNPVMPETLFANYEVE